MSIDLDYIQYNFSIYKIIIGKTENEIIIQCKNYMISFRQNELFLLTRVQFNSLDNAYDFIINIFEENSFLIKNIMKNKEMQIFLKIDTTKDFEIILLYKKDNKNFIINEINKLKIENKKVKKEIDILKGYHDNGSNPKNI